MISNSVFSATSDDARSLFSFGWKSLALRGALSVILGIICIAFPFSALFAFTLLFAAYALADGILSVISAFRRAGRGRHWIAMLLRGLLGIAVGTVFILAPFAMTITYAMLTLFLLAGWAILGGVLEIAAAIRLRREMDGEWMLALSGALSVALGIFIIILFTRNPALSVLSVGWAIGCYALASGVMLILLAFKLRRRFQSR